MVNPRDKLNDIRDRAAAARERVSDAGDELAADLDDFIETEEAAQRANIDTSAEEFNSRQAAVRRAEELGITGAHEIRDGVYRPGRTPGEFQQAIGRIAEEIESGERSGDMVRQRNPGAGLGDIGVFNNEKPASNAPGVDLDDIGAFPDGESGRDSAGFSDVGVFPGRETDDEDDGPDDILSGDGLL